MPQNISGQVFGRLNALEPAGKLHGRLAWLCQCACGQKKRVTAHALKSGNTQSCGCLTRELVIARDRKPMVGLVFNRLTILNYAYTLKKKAYWVCQCICGKTITTDGGSLRAGHVQSCGCLRVDRIPRTHGCSKTPVYNVWKTMRQRCYNPKNADYKYYGALGVRVCPQWENFETFLKDMGVPPKGFTLDRVDPSGDYTPENCRWATWKVQRHNRRSNK